ncbi:MAG: hypothetical protein LBB24_02105, partial [Rickettsiales bacterium]|nr:hypothetical protein [Rickettsiales bacterium]
MGRKTPQTRKILPSSLFYRFMLMVLVPMFLLQISSLYIFFQRYWNRSMRKNLTVLMREIRIIDGKYDSCLPPQCDRQTLLRNVNFSENFKVTLVNREYPDVRNMAMDLNNIRAMLFLGPLRRFGDDLRKLISNRVGLLERDPGTFTVSIPKPEGTLEYRISKNSILVPRVNLLVFWNVVSFLIIATIAFFFVKNQVRSIELLKNFANDFSYLEKDNGSFKPTGAREIREVGWAFLNVVRKMGNLMNARTTMLAQISHDLRTPLTRIKLQIEFINDDEIVVPLRQDLEEMERMINEYLLFSRGIVEGDYSLTDIRQFFNGI